MKGAAVAIGWAAWLVAGSASAAPEAVPVQRPSATTPTTTPTEATAAAASAPATEAEAPPAPSDAPPEAVVSETISSETISSETISSETIAPEGDAPREAAPPVGTPPETAPADATPEAATEPGGDEVLRRAEERPGPPYYNASDEAALRNRYGIEETDEVPRDPVRWRCLVADPTCGISFEVNATSAYQRRFQQGDVSDGNVRSWNTGRAQYDLWVNLPVFTEMRRRVKFTRMTFGPKGGVIFSDTGDFWGNLGAAGRYWLGRGRFAPSIEFSSALAFKLGGRPTKNLGGAAPKFESQRGPVGFTADVGFGIGGFGAIVIGGQYDSPLAREDVPEQFRVSAAGSFYIGFRGNIVWGAPAAAAVLTHGLTQRLASKPIR